MIILCVIDKSIILYVGFHGILIKSVLELYYYYYYYCYYHYYYYHLRSTVKGERFSVHIYFSNETVFTYSCDDWTNESETNVHSFVLQAKHFHESNRHSCLRKCHV